MNEQLYARALYIGMEGLDACGKDTQAEKLKEYFTDHSEPVIAIREPGGTPMGEAIRAILKDGSIDRSPETNVDLNSAVRRELRIQEIQPAIAEGRHVITTRNWLSIVAYQGFGEGVDIDYLIARSKEAMGEHFMSGKTYYLDVPLDIIEERIRDRGGASQDFFEKKEPAFFKRAREGYLWLADKYQDNITVIDGTQSIDRVHTKITQDLGAIAVKPG